MKAGKAEPKLPPEARDGLMRAWLAILRERHPSVVDSRRTGSNRVRSRSRPPRLMTVRPRGQESPSADTCEHVFVTSQGSASGRFQRACDRRQVEQAEMAAREMDG